MHEFELYLHNNKELLIPLFVDQLKRDEENMLSYVRIVNSFMNTSPNEETAVLYIWAYLVKSKIISREHVLYANPKLMVNAINCVYRLKDCRSDVMMSSYVNNPDAYLDLIKANLSEVENALPNMTNKKAVVSAIYSLMTGCCPIFNKGFFTCKAKDWNDIFKQFAPYIPKIIELSVYFGQRAIASDATPLTLALMFIKFCFDIYNTQYKTI